MENITVPEVADEPLEIAGERLRENRLARFVSTIRGASSLRIGEEIQIGVTEGPDAGALDEPSASFLLPYPRNCRS